ATRLLSACRLEQIRRLLLRATRWHAANYAATGKMQQVNNQATKDSLAPDILSLTLRSPLARHTLLATASGQSGIKPERPHPRGRRDCRGLADNSSVLQLHFSVHAMLRGRQLQNCRVLTFT